MLPVLPSIAIPSFRKVDLSSRFLVLFFFPSGDDQLNEAREKGLVTDADINMEMALQSTAGMPAGDDEDAAPTPLDEDLRSDLPLFDPGHHHEPMQYNTTMDIDHHAAYAAYDNQSTLSAVDYPEDPSDYQAAAAVIAARRATTCSTEDALAGMLFDTIVSPQTVIPQHREARLEAPEAASATKPKISKAAAAAAAAEEEAAGVVDLRALMSTGALDASKEGMFPEMMPLSPGLLAGLSAELCRTESGNGARLPVARELFS